jgi:hypothetical protein
LLTPPEEELHLMMLLGHPWKHPYVWSEIERLKTEIPGLKIEFSEEVA